MDPFVSQEKNSGAAGGDNWRNVEDLVWGELRKCYDPEIPLNIVDLGLVYGVAVRDGQARNGSCPWRRLRRPMWRSSGTRPGTKA